MALIRGYLYAWSEQGSEGFVWAVDRRRSIWRRRLHALWRFPANLRYAIREFQNSSAVGWKRLQLILGLAWSREASPYSDLNILAAGDWLTVLGDDGSLVFVGLIDPNEEVGLQPHPFNPEYLQPRALGCAIHWTQRGWEPDAWAKLFLRDQLRPPLPPLRAILIRHES